MSESPHPLQPYGTLASKCPKCQPKIYGNSKDAGGSQQHSAKECHEPRVKYYDARQELTLRFVRLERDVLVEVHYDGED